jgi:hypothetical protein
MANGTVLVATAPSSFASTDQSSFPTGIIALDPSTQMQCALSTGGLFSLPSYVVEGPNEMLYVSDLTASGEGAVIQVNPNAGQQTLLATGGLINGPNAIAFVNGWIYVADEGDASGTVHNIVRIDPNSGLQRLVTDCGGFTVPTGMVAAPGNKVYVTDEPGNFQGPDPGSVWEVDLDTGQQRLIGHGGLIDHPVDVAVDSSGNLIVANTGNLDNDVAGSVIRINPQTCVQTLITSFGAYSGTNSIEVGEDGTILVGNIANGSAPAEIIAVDPLTGDQSTVSSGGTLSLVEGIRAFHTTVQRTATTITVVSSGDPSGIGQMVSFTATVSAGTPGRRTPSGTVQFQIDGTTFSDPVDLTSAGGVATATFSTSSLAAGTHTVMACYSGDSDFTASGCTLPGGQTVAVSGSGNVIVTLTPSSGGLRITGYNDNLVLSIQQSSPSVLEVAGIGTLVNQSSDPATFTVGSVSEIDVSLLNGNDTVTMNNFHISGNVSIFAGTGSDSFFLGPMTANLISIWVAGPGQDTVSLENAIAGSVKITAGANANLSLSGVSSAGIVMLTAGSNAMVSVNNVTTTGDLDITVGDNAQSVTVKSSSFYNADIVQTGTMGSPSFDLENDTIHKELDFSAGDGNNTIVLSQITVAIELLMHLGAGKNAVSADHVTALFGFIDGGPSGKNNYMDGGGNSGFSVFDFIGH